MKVAIVYDRVNKWGGAERVLLALHEIFPKAPLYTSLYDSDKAEWAKVFPKIYTSFLQKIPLARRYHELFGTFMPIAFRSFDLRKYDFVISVTSESAKSVKTGPETIHICYCLTPTRYLWSHHNIYFKNPILKLVSRPFVWYLKWWDKNVSQKPNEIIAISTEVKKRIKKYYKRNSEVIFPPVKITGSKRNGRTNKGQYYLLVSRLDYGYKKVDLAIKTFNKLGKPLIIVGTGREKKKLEKMSKVNIKFKGSVSDRQLSKIYKNATALIMPQEEDFGIVAVEAQSHGVPVIAYNKGGARDTVIEGRTGVLFNRQTVKSLEEAVNRFEKKHFVVDNLFTNSQRFSEKIFRQKFLELVKTGDNIKTQSK